MTEFTVTLNVMLPMLLLLSLGWFLRKAGLFPDKTVKDMNTLVFKLFLPVLLFKNMREITSGILTGVSYPLFLFVSVFGLFILAFLLVPRFVHDPSKQGVMVQGIFRSNFAILGVPLMESMFGASGTLVYSVALPVVIPLNNVLAVIALSAPTGRKTDKVKIIRDILLNPLIIACVLGLICCITGLHFPTVIEDTLSRLSSITSPLSLLVLGASLKWQGVRSNRKELTWTVLLKQLIIPVVMVSIAVLLGFRNEELGVMIVLFAAPCAVSSFPMAVAMNGDGDLAAGQIVLTTVFSMLTFFILIFTMKSMHLL